MADFVHICFMRMTSQDLRWNVPFLCYVVFHYCLALFNFIYCETSSIRCTKSQNMNDPRLVLWFSLPNPLKPARYEVENKDVVGAARGGNAPTTSEWSTIVLPIELHLILEVWQYILQGYSLDSVSEATLKNMVKQESVAGGGGAGGGVRTGTKT